MNSDVVFQFLLVRLRVCTTFLKKRAKKLSIPSGAIKRNKKTLTTKTTKKLSIPSGAIKSVASYPRYPVFPKSFNSFWCD